MPATSISSVGWVAVTLAVVSGQKYKQSVYLLDKANAGYLNYTQAETLASRMFAVIGISLEWTKKKPADESPQPPIIIEVVRRTPTNLMPGSLAYAVRREGS